MIPNSNKRTYLKWIQNDFSKNKFHSALTKTQISYILMSEAWFNPKCEPYFLCANIKYHIASCPNVWSGLPRPLNQNGGRSPQALEARANGDYLKRMSELRSDRGSQIVFKGQIACWIVAQQAMAYHACWNERAFILSHHASYITVCQGNLKCKKLLKGFRGYH